jgi:hypothetical protein
MNIFLDITQCSSSKNRHFVGMYHLHLHGNIPKYSVCIVYVVSLYGEANQDTFDKATAHRQ